MFYPRWVQLGFCFLAGDIRHWHARLAPVRTGLALPPVRGPIAQLVKSMISGRTRDAVSQAAFERLVAAFPGPARIAAARPEAVERVIGDVTFAANKAVNVVRALARLRADPHGFDLDRLGGMPLAAALGFLERFDGVARKVSASTLNASTLAMPVLIVDTHVLRVLQRLGAVDARADYRIASEAVTAAMPRWTGADFLAFHIGMKRLGQTICRADRPDCARCPLRETCVTADRRGPAVRADARSA